MTTHVATKACHNHLSIGGRNFCRQASWDCQHVCRSGIVGATWASPRVPSTSSIRVVESAEVPPMVADVPRFAILPFCALHKFGCGRPATSRQRMDGGLCSATPGDSWARSSSRHLRYANAKAHDAASEINRAPSMPHPVLNASKRQRSADEENPSRRTMYSPDATPQI